jgi:hypothetical protein
MSVFIMKHFGLVAFVSAVGACAPSPEAICAKVIRLGRDVGQEDCQRSLIDLKKTDERRYRCVMDCAQKAKDKQALDECNRKDGRCSASP